MFLQLSLETGWAVEIQAKPCPDQLTPPQPPVRMMSASPAQSANHHTETHITSIQMTHLE